MESFDSIHPRAFLEKLEAKQLDEALIVDVREQWEWDYYHLDEAKLMPMNTIPSRMGELPDDRPIYIVCAHGVRSANVCYYLREQGFEHVVNIEGGMAAVGMLRGFQYD